MNPLDPAVAALRCWEHEDCLEHPELALACADGASTPVGVAGSGACDNLTTHETIYGDGHGDTRGDGDGQGNMWGCWSGNGAGYGLPTIHDADVFESNGDGGSPCDPGGGVGGSDDAWIALDFADSYYTIFPAEAERFIVEGRLHRRRARRDRLARAGALRPDGQPARPLRVPARRAAARNRRGRLAGRPARLPRLTPLCIQSNRG